MNRESPVTARRQAPDLEVECINLLSRLENITARLAEHSRRQRLAECLLCAKELLIAFLEYGERHPLPHGDPALDQLQAAYAATKDLERHANQDPWSKWKSMLGMVAESSFETQQKYTELGEAYRLLIQGVFPRFLQQLRPSDTKDHLLRSVEEFVEELGSRW